MVRTGKPDRKVIENAQAALVEEGTKLRTQVLGEKHVTTLGEAPAFLQPIRNMAAAGGWAMCWTRPGLELKTRSLLCIVMLSVLGKDHELAVHVRGAVQNGCAVTEIREALFQVNRAPSPHAAGPGESH